jgi:PhzF family phenazine biosynthesis protein
MPRYAFRILNVFTLPGQRLSGNPLCVLEDARGLSDSAMQAVARQMNLSETTFILPAETQGATETATATARVRIFTPTFEMPFAGHPTLGTASVVSSLRGGSEAVTLQMAAGLVDVKSRGNEWTLRAAQAPATRAPEANRAELAAMLGLEEAAIGDGGSVGVPRWVDTGAEQLVIPLRSTEDVRRARVDPVLLLRDGYSRKRGASMAYVFASEAGNAEHVVARFFFDEHGAAVEDPATGSACANLGGWWLTEGRPLPVHRTIRQGDAVARPSQLRLHVDQERHIYVTGEVWEVGRGELDL